ncbi:hypothetical protein ACQP25_16920 [Microtetraspora malaysiensis]|uniref:hypothetical protein n=1 Tax=Microtetraspora malaysiensis TaxID=161358 RepID=UPI003D93405B
MGVHRISGLTPDQERLYRHMLATGPSPVETLVAAFSERVRGDLYELTLRGLALGDPPVARRPSIALKGVLAHQEEELRGIHQYVADLDRLYDNGHATPEGDALEVLTSREAVQHWYEQIHATAELEVMQLITHPFLVLSAPAATGASADPEPGHPAKCRVICEWRVFESNHALRGLNHSVSRGCEVRLADRLPHKLLIGDRRLAMTPRFPREHQETRQMLLIHPGTLLDFLVKAFEAEWERATPIHADPSRFAEECGDMDSAEMVIVEMLSRGLHVDRIAHALSVHTRTVNRRLDELKRRAGVTTLFQLGAYAAQYWMRGTSSGSEDA